MRSLVLPSLITLLIGVGCTSLERSVDFGGFPSSNGGSVNIGLPSTKATFSSVSVFIGSPVNASSSGAVTTASGRLV